MRKRIGFMCGEDFNIEVEGYNATIYASTALLKKMNPCWQNCGIVKVAVEVIEDVYRGKTDE